MDAKDQAVDVHDLVKRNPSLQHVPEFQGKHPALTSDKNFDKHFDSLLKNHTKETLKDSRIKKAHLDKAIGDESWSVREAAASHSNATKEHIDRALGDDSEWVSRAAARHPKATKEHLDKALGHKNWAVRAEAVGHPKATKEHLDRALADDSEWVHDAAKRRLAKGDYK